MKNRLTALLLVLLAFQVHAQQRPHYTQYILNNFIINPAVAGIENYWDVKVSHRQQWVGLDGAPQTTYLTVQGPLHKSDYEQESVTGFHASGENPRGRAYWQDYTAPDPHGGFGLTVINDRTGPLNRFSASAAFAYHIGLSPKTNLSAGLQAGIQQMNLNAGKLDFGTLNPVDPAVAGSGKINKIRPDLSAGLWLYSSNYFVGLAAQNIIPEGVGFDGGRVVGDSIVLLKGKLVPHLFFSAGYRTFLSEDISLLPSLMVKYVQPAPVSVDFNLKAQYQDLFWVGGTVRYKDGFAAMVGMNISSGINIGYSYDFTATRLNTVSYGTHEIVVGFSLGNKYGDWCPRNIW